MKTLTALLLLTLLPTAFAADLEARDKTFVEKAAAGGLAEVELGQLAADKATNADLKAFAQMMVTDHSKANAELKELASKKGVTLPTKLEEKYVKLREKMSGLSGAEFDRNYASEMVDDHEEDVKMFEEEAEKGSDSEIKAFAAQTLPVLRGHLAKIREIQKAL